MQRARDRKVEGYTEKHHVVPRCLGGSDDPSNLVRLTPEEHYVAHQLLVKLYPGHKGLAWAAIQMTSHHTGKRSSNKLFGWLRRANSAAMKGRKWNHVSPLKGKTRVLTDDHKAKAVEQCRINAHAMKGTKRAYKPHNLTPEVRQRKADLLRARWQADPNWQAKAREKSKGASR